MTRWIAIFAFLFAVAAQGGEVGQKNLLMRHRGGAGGGGGGDTYGQDAWSWLDFRARGLLYADTNATVVATNEVRAVRDKVHGRIWNVRADPTAQGSFCRIVEDGIIGAKTVGGNIDYTNERYFRCYINEPLWGGDANAVVTNDFCQLTVLRCDQPIVESVQRVFRRYTSADIELYFSTTKIFAYYVGYGVNNTNAAVSTYNDGKLHIFSMTREWTGSGSTGTFTISIDGKEIIRRNQSTGTGSMYPALGMENTFAGNAACEYLVFDHMPDNYDEIVAALMRKYGIERMQ